MFLFLLLFLVCCFVLTDFISYSLVFVCEGSQVASLFRAQMEMRGGAVSSAPPSFAVRFDYIAEAKDEIWLFEGDQVR